jgi:hypothetical protein
MGEIPYTVYAAVIPALPFKPVVHVHYQKTVLKMKDGLPKQKDVPRLGRIAGGVKHYNLSPSDLALLRTKFPATWAGVRGS